MIPKLICALVANAGQLTDDGLASAFKARGIAITHARERLVHSFTWYLKAKGFLSQSEDKHWLAAGNVGPLPEVCPQSIDDLTAEAMRLLGQGIAADDLAERLAAAIAGPGVHIPKPYFRAIGAATWKATHQR